MKDQIIKFWRDEEGATAIEYGLIAGLIAAVIVGAVTGLGTQIRTLLNNILTAIGGTAAT
ncbi:Flp family type IVb pilin [Comamonas sp. Tr-654]|uniref:Flp family type IVb pilin n=1 Tax=unclassified Comamonas TaxID=2638500 RepID=UPI0012D277F5|nr:MULTISPECIES: Flp family type IVb pilin [unclassified Comamonas]MPS92107.1 Flp family type IVb pilin [Comamonas sp.]NIF83053.1 Flp family type IVb pilin [Comamonas sp. Tr-654]